MSLNPPNWGAFRDAAPSQDGWLHLILSFGPESLGEPSGYRLGEQGLKPALEGAAAPTGVPRYEWQDSARHELNLAALLVCLMTDEAELTTGSWVTHAGLAPTPLEHQPWLDVTAPANATPAELKLPWPWVDAWPQPASAGPSGEAGWLFL